MGFFSIIEAPFVDLYEALVPPAMKTELGALANSFVANISYDAQQLEGAALTLAQADVAQIWVLVKNSVAQVEGDLMGGKFEPTLAGVVAELSSVAVKDVFPALRAIGVTTLTTMVRTAGAMVAAAAKPAAPAPATVSLTPAMIAAIKAAVASPVAPVPAAPVK